MSPKPGGSVEACCPGSTNPPDFDHSRELIRYSLMAPKRLYLSPPHLSGREGEYVSDVFDSNWVAPVGPHLTEFEQVITRRLGVDHALAVSSGTSAIHLALRHLELKPHDEVLCSTFTFCASANPIVYEGATPVFIDSERESWSMDPDLLEEELVDCARRGKLPRAIIVVDALGQSADFDRLKAVATGFEVPIIEDAAGALGGRHRDKSIGSSGWCSILSFNGNKIITTSGGGALCSNDTVLIENARSLATQARDPVPHYEHSQIGFNYRLSNVLAAVGLAQLEVLDQRVEAKTNILNFYRQRLGCLPGITFMPEPHFVTPNCWLSTIQIDEQLFGINCEALRLRLEKENIESRRVWKPLHQQPAFHGCRVRGGAVADELFSTGLSLPSGSAMTPEDLERVATTVESSFAG